MILQKFGEKYIHYRDKILFKYYYNKLVSKGRRTSMSDNDAYPVVCYIASKQEAFFKNFRRNPTYNVILEHLTERQGQEYLDVINQNDKMVFTDADWEQFCRNDLYGNPFVFPYEINGRMRYCSPTTLRYVKVLQDIITLFDVGQIRSIAEIGIGYAGECRMITSFFKGLESYTLFDLPEVLGLARKYLGKFGEACTGKVEFADGTNIDVDREYDFVISNYAFSELVRSVQDVYLEKVILKAKAGYITWNTLSCDVLDGYRLDEILKKLPNPSVIEEKPLTTKDNCIIIWGNK